MASGVAVGGFDGGSHGRRRALALLSSPLACAMRRLIPCSISQCDRSGHSPSKPDMETGTPVVPPPGEHWVLAGASLLPLPQLHPHAPLPGTQLQVPAWGGFPGMSRGHQGPCRHRRWTTDKQPGVKQRDGDRGDGQTGDVLLCGHGSSAGRQGNGGQAPLTSPTWGDGETTQQ